MNTQGFYLLFLLVSGALLGLTPGTAWLWPLAWVALVPLWWGTFSDKRPLIRGMLWGAAYHGLALSWLTHLHPLTWLGIPWSLSLVIALTIWLLVTLWGAFWVGVWAWTTSRIRQPLLRLLAGVSLWCGLETLASLTPLWWTTLALTQSPGNPSFLHLGQLSGPVTPTAWIMLVNGVLALAVFYPKKIILPLAVGLFCLGQTLGWFLQVTAPRERVLAYFPVGIIQPNIPNPQRFTPLGRGQMEQRLRSGYETLASQGAEIILTPEGALGQEFTPNHALTSSIQKWQIPLVLGAYGRQNGQLTNSLFMLDRRGEVISRYDKVKMVPLGEFIPFETWLGGWVRRISALPESQSAGTLSQSVRTLTGPVMAGICYDSAFAPIFRTQAQGGGEWIITAANNDPYPPRMMRQHQAQDVLRAIETDRWLVRATNTGISGVISPQGQIIWQAEPQEYATHLARIYRRSNRTIYVRYGDWLTPSLGGIFIMIFLIRWRS
ncbi:apolipoprotein N-acyltransferase [Gloeomargarita lithophora Alchichica-D10]|uniref:Apolipoprotein N-acyltransferase n=1 Tax=Gloeomargarita lithophora Alchichica-D10 TaxID=1188229 RepID=A0A1J0A992_9CYAN|nr:apolipoprotein N-acyltransferase [Gloeomargarita lithophora]APB32500.1 apolipoprotein N-acyltransferase [Gloeomargarita lithophora Alchichica-D10]